MLVEGLRHSFAEIYVAYGLLVDLLQPFGQQIQIALYFLAMWSALPALEQFIQLQVTHRIIPQYVGLDVLQKFTAMLVLLSEIEEVLDAVQTFMIAEHVHEVMFVFGYVFQILHWIVGFEHCGSFLLVVVFLILRGEAEVSGKKWLIFGQVVVGVCFAVLSKKIALALVEVLVLVLHVYNESVGLLKNIKTAVDQLSQLYTTQTLYTYGHTSKRLHPHYPTLIYISTDQLSHSAPQRRIVCDVIIIISIQMRKLLSTPLLRYNYLQNFKKPVVEMPSHTPPKYIYQVEYHPASLPDFDMKFRDHAHANDWEMLAYGEQQKFDFQYSGQWWETISIGGRLAWLLFFGGTMYLFLSQTNYRKQKKFPGMASYYNATDLPIVHFPTLIQH